MKHGLKRFTRYVLVAALSVSLAVPDNGGNEGRSPEPDRRFEEPAERA